MDFIVFHFIHNFFPFLHKHRETNPRHLQHNRAGQCAENAHIKPVINHAYKHRQATDSAANVKHWQAGRCEKKTVDIATQAMPSITALCDN